MKYPKFYIFFPVVKVTPPPRKETEEVKGEAVTGKYLSPAP